MIEHKGKIYFADWKSDICLQYEGEVLKKHVEAHYMLQAQLYTIGVIRWLKIKSETDYKRRFGGLIYLFLRGFKDDSDWDQGVYFMRPTWAEVCGYEAELSTLINHQVGR